jgi:hypothetical protein
MKPIPLYDATAPIACTATGPELVERVAQLARWRSVLLGVERTAHGVVLRLPLEWEHDVRRFVVDESACCGFWGFAVSVDDGSVALRWDAPPDAGPLLDQLLGVVR